MKDFSFFKHLPSELTRYILSFNSPHEHGKVAITSKDLQKAADVSTTSDIDPPHHQSN